MSPADSPPALRADPFERRKRLAKTLQRGPLLAISPGLNSSATANYFNDQNYLPFANYLSEQMGVLVIPAYETTLEGLREAILAREYPIIHASALLFDDLRRAGYVPVATNSPGAEAVFLVKTSSPIQDMEHLSRHSVAIDASSPVGATALAALQAQGLDKTVRIIDAARTTYMPALDRLLDGGADAGVVSTVQAANAQRRNPGAVRILKSYPLGVTDGVWAYPEAVNERDRKRLASALERLSASADDRDVTRRLIQATQMPVSFKATAAR